MGYIKEIKIGSGTANLIEPILYGTTNTAAGTQAKEVSISNFELVTGVTIAVKFTVTNTHATPQLNINSTGAKLIKYRGGNLPSAATLTANRVYQFVYDGTNWELIGDLDTAVIHNTLTSAKGDMIYASAANTPTRLAIGTAGYFLKATANGPTWANTTDITALGTVTTGTWNATVIGAAYGGTGQNTLQKSANALINALDTGSSDLTSNDYVITQYVGGGTTTTTYHRRPASKVVNATLVKAALGTVSTTAKKFLKDTGSWVQVDWGDLTNKPSTFTPADHTQAVDKGGTNITSYTIGDILYASAATTLSKLAGNTTTTRKFLTSVATTNGTAVAPKWDTLTKSDVGLGNVANSTYAGGTAVTLNNSSKASSTASFYAPTTGGAANTQALVGNGATAAPKWVDISPSITIGAGTGSAAPTVNVTVLGQLGTAKSITTASTSVYGVTKLNDGITSNSTSLAATANSALVAAKKVASSNSASKLYLVGATSQSTTGVDSYSYQYTYTNNGLLSALKLGLNLNGTEKAHLEWNATDQSIDFIFD